MVIVLNNPKPPIWVVKFINCVYEYHNAYKNNGLLMHLHLNLLTFLSIGVKRQCHVHKPMAAYK